MELKLSCHIKHSQLTNVYNYISGTSEMSQVQPIRCRDRFMTDYWTTPFRRQIFGRQTRLDEFFLDNRHLDDNDVWTTDVWTADTI